MLTTTGARTGRSWTLPALGLGEGDSLIVIASNYGRSRNPSQRWAGDRTIPVIRLEPSSEREPEGVARVPPAQPAGG